MGPSPATPVPDQLATQVDTPAGRARHRLRATQQELAAIVRETRHEGVADVAALGRCAHALVDQLLEDVDTTHWALRTESQGSYFHRRAIGTALIAATLGRQLGLDRPALDAVATGGLLLDLGKIAVPVPILAKPVALDVAEQAYVRRHVERGMELVAGGDTPPRALEMLAGHHERADGGGYPQGLRGSQIPLFARLAAVADAFDAMTLNRSYAAAMAPTAVLHLLGSLGGERYDAAMVNELKTALGRYPTGSLVELTDGTVGVVCAQRRDHPAEPQVIVSHDAARQSFGKPRLADPAGDIGILRSLSPNAVRLDCTLLDAALARPGRAAA